MQEDIKNIIYKAIKEVNRDLNISELENPTDDTPLFELLDSMAILDFILEVESSLQDMFGKYIQIANEYSMDSNKTPFKSVKTTTDYILERISNG